MASSFSNKTNFLVRPTRHVVRVIRLVNRLLHGIIIFKQSQLSCKIYTLYGTSNPVSKSTITWYHHFQTKPTFLQDLHIKWYE